MRIIRSKALPLVLALTASTWACGDDDPTEPDDVVTITLSGITFSPDDVTIDAGTTIRWVNGDGFAHTATPDGNTEWSSWITNSQGQTFEHRFNTPGTYDYFCQPHEAQGMEGVIRVE